MSVMQYYILNSPRFQLVADTTEYARITEASCKRVHRDDLSDVSVCMCVVCVCVCDVCCV